MPAQERRRRDEPVSSQYLRQDPRERGKDGTVGPVETRFRVAAAKHRDLVTQHEYLRVL
ncbi:hypothetical protein [Micromonospora sp. NPDC005161]